MAIFKIDKKLKELRRRPSGTRRRIASRLVANGAMCLAAAPNKASKNALRIKATRLPTKNRFCDPSTEIMMTEPQTFLSIYDNEYAGRLGKRSEGFREIFRALEVQNKEFYRIVETGTTRKVDNWEGDGQSTILFDRFVNFYDGAVFSCDIDPVAVGVARSLTSYKTHCVCSDSVRFLKHYSDVSGGDKQADLFYLDSFDLKLDDPFPSMFHHIKELLAIGSLRKGVVIAVDDNLVHNGQDIGKGKLVAEYFSNLGVDKLYDGYQSVWQV